MEPGSHRWLRIARIVTKNSVPTITYKSIVVDSVGISMRAMGSTLPPSLNHSITAKSWYTLMVIILTLSTDLSSGMSSYVKAILIYLVAFPHCDFSERKGGCYNIKGG